MRPHHHTQLVIAGTHLFAASSANNDLVSSVSTCDASQGPSCTAANIASGDDAMQGESTEGMRVHHGSRWVAVWSACRHRAAHGRAEGLLWRKEKGQVAV